MLSENDHGTPLILVDADGEEVANLLRETLSGEEFSRLRVIEVPDPQEVHLGGRRGVAAEAMITAVQFVGMAILGGYTHDLFKSALSRLVTRFGANRVFTKESVNELKE